MLELISDKQAGLIRELSNQIGRTPDSASQDMHGRPLAELTKAEASQLIDRLLEISRAHFELWREYKGSKATGWIRCNSTNRCKICGRKKYCSTTADSKFAVCTKNSAGSMGETREGHYIHKLDTTDFIDTSLRPQRIVQSQPKLSTDELERRATNFTAVYSALLELSPATLSDQLMHGEKGLSERGLADKGHEYGMLPGPYVERLSLTKRIIERLEETRPRIIGYDNYRDVVLSAPGFWTDGYNQDTIWLADNTEDLLVIPYRDSRGRIQGCQLRVPDAPHDRRYQWLSSTPFVENGPSPGTPIHYVQSTFKPDQGAKKNLITEGALKGDAAGNFLFAYTITTTSGVTCAHQELIAAAVHITRKQEQVVIAYDKDHRRNDKVCRQIARLITGLLNAGLTVRVLTWSTDIKGIDDVLLSPNLKSTTFTLLEPLAWLKSLSRKVKEEAVKAFIQIEQTDSALKVESVRLQERYDSDKRARKESLQAA